MGWIIAAVAAAALLALLCIRVGVYAKYDEGKFLLRLLIGPCSITLIPREKEAQTKDSPPKEEKSAEKKPSSFQKPNLSQIRYLLETLPGILKKALRRAGKGILVKPLHLRVVFAGEDPADTAEHYGKAQAFVSALYPAAKKLIRIRDTKLALSADYQREETVITGEMGIFLRIGTILRIALAAGVGLLCSFTVASLR